MSKAQTNGLAKPTSAAPTVRATAEPPTPSNRAGRVSGSTAPPRLPNVTTREIAAAAAAAAAKEEEEYVRQAQSIMNMDLGDLNFSAVDMDFNEVDDDLSKFQNDDIVKDALSKGVDLRNYSRSIEEQLVEAEGACVNDYIQESDGLADLHLEIKKCDNILQKMQQMLSKFQGDLGNISSEIKHLQDKSMQMSIQLRNRKMAEEKLAHFISSLIVSEDLINHVCEDEVNDAYLEYLLTLNQKLQAVTSAPVQGTKASLAVEPTIEKLRLKAIQRVRQFLLTRIAEFTKRGTNIQVKQDLLLRYKYFYEFLVDNQRPSDASDIVGEVRLAYIATMDKLNSSKFRNYLTDMKGLQKDFKMDKGDLLGTDDSKTGGLFSTKKSKQHLDTVFTLGHRDEVLHLIDKDPIMFHVAQSGKQSFPYEFIFRSVQHLLMHTSTAEYAFLTEFFDRKEKGSVEKENMSFLMFSRIFGNTQNFLLENLEDFLFTCYDAIGVCLLIRIVYQHNKIMQQKNVHVLDSFFDRQNMLLWTRFKAIFDANLESLKEVNLDKLDKNSTLPHYVVMRYAHFSAAISSLNRGYDDAIINTNLRRLRVEIEGLLGKAVAKMGVHKTRVIFLINNYDYIIQVFQEQNINSEEKQRFEELLRSQISVFVEEELSEKFNKLIAFVKQTEPQLANAKGKAPVRLVDATVEGIIKHFAGFYKEGMERINANVMKSFPKQPGGPQRTPNAEILKQTMMQLVLYYERFQAIVKECYGTPLPAFAREMIPHAQLMFEVKRYGTARAE